MKKTVFILMMLVMGLGACATPSQSVETELAREEEILPVAESVAAEESSTVEESVEEESVAEESEEAQEPEISDFQKKLAESEFLITEEAVILKSEKFLLSIPKGVYVPGTIVEDIEFLISRMEEVSGLKMLPGDKALPITIEVKRNGLEGELGAAYAEGSTVTISPGDLLLRGGMGLALTHEMFHCLHNRNFPRFCQIMTEGYATCMVEKVIQTDPFYYDFNSYSNYQTTEFQFTADNGEELFRSVATDEDGWLSYLYGFRFVTFLTDTYGTDALQKLAEHESFGTNYFTEYSADTIIDALKDVFGEDIFLQFSEWVNDPACYQNEYLPCDTTAFEQIDVFPCFGGWNFYSLSNILYEDGLRLDFAKGFRYLEEYKGYETVGIAGTIRGKEEVISFYDEQQQLLKQIDLSAEGGYVQFDIPDASYLVIEGDGGEIDFSFDFDSMAHL